MTLKKTKEKKKMKTRSNMPLFVVECDNVKTLSNAQIDLLRCGDYLVKKDASGEHAYKVTFKSDTGMCITYHDASVIETQSYDKVDGVWTYNSEDKTPNLLNAQTENDVIELLGSGDVPSIKADEIIENMSGYSATMKSVSGWTYEKVFCGACKNGNKLTLVIAFNITKTDEDAPNTPYLIDFIVPNTIMAKLYPTLVGLNSVLDTKAIHAFSALGDYVELPLWLEKESNKLPLQLYCSNLALNTKYYARYETTFLLSEDIIS